MILVVDRGRCVRRLRSNPLVRRTVMILVTTTVEDVDRFLDVFGTKGADKRALYGSKGSAVFRDPTEENRVWGLLDWGEAGGAKIVPAPQLPPLLQDTGILGTLGPALP